MGHGLPTYYRGDVMPDAVTYEIAVYVILGLAVGLAFLSGVWLGELLGGGK